MADEGLDDANKSNEQKKGFFQNLIDTIKEEIRDLSYVEIITAVGDAKAKINTRAEDMIEGTKDAEITIKARTRIELDGDIAIILPSDTKNGDLALNDRILEIHKQNVDIAVQNWNAFMQNMFNALKLVIDITGLSKSVVLEDFKQPVSTKE